VTLDLVSASDVRIVYYSAEDALQLREPVLSVYFASHHDQQHNPWFSPEQFWRRLVELYAPSRDFKLVAAWEEDTMVGYAFGSPKDNSADVWQMVERALPEIPIPDPPEPIYFFREFAVDPKQQGKGYGRRLHDALLKTRPESLAHLLVRPDNPAEATYLHWGWQMVGQVQPFSDAPALHAMVRVLPVLR
jgi:GNAT superfamily N-acetyltransferase